MSTRWWAGSTPDQPVPFVDWDLDRDGNAHAVHGHFAALVNRADPGDLDPEDTSAGREWEWMLVDTDDPDRGILDGNDMWTPVTRAQGIKDATASLIEHDQKETQA